MVGSRQVDKLEKLLVIKEKSFLCYLVSLRNQLVYSSNSFTCPLHNKQLVYLSTRSLVYLQQNRAKVRKDFGTVCD